MQQDPYQVLGVARDASDEDIRRAFRRQVLRTRPDRKSESEASDEAFRRVKDAFEAIVRERSAGDMSPDMPAWAVELLARLTRARDAAQRGNFGSAAEEMQVLAGTVAERVSGTVAEVTEGIARVRARAEEVRRTVRGLGRILRGRKGHPRRGPA